MKLFIIVAGAGLTLGTLFSSMTMAQQAQAVGPYKDFKGTIKLDVRDSVADWGPFTPKKAPAGAPNILFVLYDDTGLAAWSPYGGRINMPTLDRLAKNGLTYTQWHTVALCSPTRSTLLTGRNHTLNGMAAITEASNGFPGWAGRIPPQAATVAQVLQDNGYSTFWLGKNHNVPEQDVAEGGDRKTWPLGQGFERFYGFIGGETNQWYPDLVEDNHFIEPPYGPGEGLPPVQGPGRSGDQDDPRPEGRATRRSRGSCSTTRAPTTRRTTRRRSTSTSTRASSTTATRRTAPGCWRA